MSRNEPSNSQEHAGPGAGQEKRGRKPDERARRTRDRLGSAFVALIHEKPIENVTVQDVLNRAKVGRSTFYLHFRDKNDLLLSQLEVFLDPPIKREQLLQWANAFQAPTAEELTLFDKAVRLETLAHFNE